MEREARSYARKFRLQYFMPIYFLLNSCFDISIDKLKGRIQHRADQNPEELLNYWSGVTGIHKKNFYKSYVDKRTIGRKTKKSGYKGVCTITCAGTHIQLELEQIADIIFEALGGYGAAGSAFVWHTKGREFESR